MLSLNHSYFITGKDLRILHPQEEIQAEIPAASRALLQYWNHTITLTSSLTLTVVPHKLLFTLPPPITSWRVYPSSIKSPSPCTIPSSAILFRPPKSRLAILGHLHSYTTRTQATVVMLTTAGKTFSSAPRGPQVCLVWEQCHRISQVVRGAV